MDLTEKKKVLIADDEPGMRMTLTDILADNGCDVSTAENGLEAVKMCEREDYDVVLMDVRMPGGIDGVEAFRRIRQSRKSVNVILMSAYGKDELKHDALREGAIAFLDKPLNLDTVIQLVADSAGLSILAVTNDDGFAGLLPSCLSSTAEKLTVVRSSDEALQLMRQLNYDICLIDAELPTGTGLDCYLAMRTINRTITAIMVSDSADELIELAEEAVRRTAYTVIQKPLQPEKLSMMLEKLRGQRISGSVRKPDKHEP